MQRLEEDVRRLLDRAEFLIVLATAFALPVTLSLIATFGPVSAQQQVQLTNVDLQALIVQEAVVLLLLGWFLRVRGWHVAHFAAHPSWRELGEALGLFLLTSALCLVIGLAGNGGMEKPASGNALDWAMILAVSIMNPLFEELFLCAYVLPFVIARRGTSVAVAVSLAIRLSYHTYQGAGGMILVAIAGLVLSIYFVRTRRIWPVLIAHGLLDFIGLAAA